MQVAQTDAPDLCWCHVEDIQGPESVVSKHGGAVANWQDDYEQLATMLPSQCSTAWQPVGTEAPAKIHTQASLQNQNHGASAVWLKQVFL